LKVILNGKIIFMQTGNKMSRMAIGPLKTFPKDSESNNHKLLVQAGFVRQLMAGGYSYLPLGLRVLKKIEQVIRKEMDRIGSQEILMPALHPASIWKQSGGWKDVDVLFKLTSRVGKEYALGQSHEEVVTPLAKEAINSYKDLPLSLYQIQWKFRDELRAKSGILRGREFYMKDMYSWHETKDDFEDYYKKVKEAYLLIFEKLGLVAKVTQASGGAFSDKISYEFEVITKAGEANILFCKNCDYCVNVDDIAEYKSGDLCPGCKKQRLEPAKAAEVGNIFDLGNKYTKIFDLRFVDKNGEKKYPIMGCYGIGISRTMGVLVEKFNDERGIIWPETVAPYKLSLISLEGGEIEAKKLYKELIDQKIEVLWDDRNESAGVKFADADLIGNPYRIVISKKSLEGGGVEIKKRDSKQSEIVSREEALQKLSND